MLGATIDSLEGENTKTQYCVLGYRIDLYFHDYILAIEVHEFNHFDRNIDYKIKKQKVTEKELDCKFARNKHGENDFNIFKAYTHTHLKII